MVINSSISKMKNTIKFLFLVLITGFMSCRETKKEVEESNVQIEKIEKIEAEVNKISEDLEKESQEIENKLNELEKL